MGAKTCFIFLIDCNTLSRCYVACVAGGIRERASGGGGLLIPSNLVPRAHVPFGQHQDKEIWRLEIKVDVDTFHKGIQYALGKLGNWKQTTRRLWERACWLFQSSVSWCWPKGTWALGTRLYSLASEGIGRDQYGSLPKQKHSSAKSPSYVGYDARWRKTKVFIILTWHNQLSNSWTKTLNWKRKIRFFELIILNENVGKQSKNTQWKCRTNKVKILTLK